MKIITTAFAALAIAASLSSPAAAWSSSTVCQSVRGSGYRGTVCESTTIRDPAPAPVEVGPLRGPATSEFVPFDPIEAARVLAIPKHIPGSPLCVLPYRMTARDGCQR